MKYLFCYMLIKGKIQRLKLQRSAIETVPKEGNNKGIL